LTLAANAIRVATYSSNLRNARKTALKIAGLEKTVDADLLREMICVAAQG